MSMTEAEMIELGLVPLSTEMEPEEEEKDTAEVTTAPTQQPAVTSDTDLGLTPVREVPMTRQELYGDLEQELSRAESQMGGVSLGPTGRPVVEEDAFAVEDVEEIERIRKELQERYNEATQGGEQLTTTDSKGNVVLIPPPAMADNPALATAARTVSELGRGLAATISIAVPGVTAEEAQNLIPAIRDESDVVNVGSEALQLIAGAGTGALGAAKLMDSVLRKTPKAARWVASVVGAPLGEAAVATEETGTLTGDEEDTVLQRKLRVLAEGAAFGTSLEIAGQGIKTISELSPMARIFRSLPVALMGTREGAERLTADTLADLIARAEDATTPEDKVKALEALQDRIATNFESQTGVNFKDYVEGRVELPKDAFEPTLGGVAGSDILARVERGVSQREGIAEFSGRAQTQRESMLRDIPRAVEQVVPPAQRIEGETTRQASERLGAEAREEIGAEVTARIEPERTQVVSLEDQLSQAVREVDAKFAPEAEATFAGLNRSRSNAQVANSAAEEATETVESVYLAGREQKNKVYTDYLDQAEEIEIPAEQFEQALTSITDPAEIADMAKLVASSNPAYGRVLRQLSSQRKRLDDAIESRVNQIAGEEASSAQRAKARESINVDELKEEIGYQDVKLSNLEGLLQAVNSVQARTGAEIGAVNLLKSGLEQSIDRAIGNNEALRASREGAIQYFQNFQDLYKTATGSQVIPNFRFGDKISEQQFKQAQAGLSSVLKDAGSDPASAQFLTDIRASMDEDTLREFNDSVAKFYRHDIYSSVKYDPSTQLARGNPQNAAQSLSAGLTRALTKYPNLEQIAPGVAEEITALTRSLDQSADNVASAQSAVTTAQNRLEEAIKLAEETPEAQFARPAYTTSATKAVKSLILDENSVRQFPDIWRSAGRTGRVGPDGLTDTQRKLKATVAQGTMEIVYPAASRGAEKGELSLAKIDAAIEENPVFELVFPEGSADREMFDTLVARTRAIAKRDVRQLGGESATATIENVGQLVSELINYVEGPLSEEGRRSKILSRTFFKLAGGPERAREVITETFLDTRLANRLLEQAKERVRMTGESLEEAKVKALGTYLLTRFGVRSIEELNNEVQSVAVEEETEGAFPAE